MGYRKKFVVEPGAKVRLAKIDPSYTGKHKSHEEVLPEIQKNLERMGKLPALCRRESISPRRLAGARCRRQGRHHSSRF
jgi:hypothetical protein